MVVTEDEADDDNENDDDLDDELTIFSSCERPELDCIGRATSGSGLLKSSESDLSRSFISLMCCNDGEGETSFSFKGFGDGNGVAAFIRMFFATARELRIPSSKHMAPGSGIPIGQ